MFLPSNDGIICDFCGTIYKDQFEYYSTRSVEYQMLQNIRSAPRDAGLNSDICISCYNILMEDVKNNLGIHHKDKIKCDLSKTWKSGTFVYYIIYFDKVVVNRNSEEENQVKVEKNVMDLNVINGMDKLIERTQVIKKKTEIQGETWS